MEIFFLIGAIVCNIVVFKFFIIDPINDLKAKQRNENKDGDGI